MVHRWHTACSEARDTRYAFNSVEALPSATLSLPACPLCTGVDSVLSCMHSLLNCFIFLTCCLQTLQHKKYDNVFGLGDCAGEYSSTPTGCRSHGMQMCCFS